MVNDNTASNISEALRIAADVGYPVKLVAHGGGVSGKGKRKSYEANNDGELRERFSRVMGTGGCTEVFVSHF